MPVNRFVCFDVLRLTSTRLPTRWTLSGSAGLMQDWTSSASLRRGMKMLKTFRFVDCALRVCSCWSVLVPFGLGRGPTTYPIKIAVEWRWSHLLPSGLQSSTSHLSLSPSSISSPGLRSLEARSSLLLSIAQALLLLQRPSSTSFAYYSNTYHRSLRPTLSVVTLIYVSTALTTR